MVWKTRSLAAGGAFLLLVFLFCPSGLSADLDVFRAPSRILSLFALPGEEVAFDLATYAGVGQKHLSRFQVTAIDPVVVTRDAKHGFRITAPGVPGIYPIDFQETPDRGLSAPLPYRVQLVVMVPADQAVEGMLGGYPVGIFPDTEIHQEWRFEPPRGFVEITEENREHLLSDHVRLGELDCKLDAPYPHYAVIQTSILVKLEALGMELSKRGLPGDHLRIMSGFRTPEYNRSVGNRTTFSRHIAGDAADVFVDADNDDRMDDLNGDGRINRLDSRFLLALVEELDDSRAYGALVGGASAYRANHDHGPFVHVDTRGYPARW